MVIEGLFGHFLLCSMAEHPYEELNYDEGSIHFQTSWNLEASVYVFNLITIYYLSSLHNLGNFEPSKIRCILYQDLQFRL